MIVVDSSVWIDFLNGRPTRVAEVLAALIANNSPIALTEMVFAEVLRGYRDEEAARHIESHLRAYPVLALRDLDDWAFAARLFREARRNGVTISNGADCMIAAPCIREGAELFHNDSDFDRLAEVSELRIFDYADSAGVN